MGSRLRIGVTGDHRSWSPSWWCISFVLRVLGVEPQRISVRHPTDDHFDAMIISGGMDIGPELYGGTETPKVRIDRQRDQLESHWIQRSLAEGWPLLGICRGAQLLNVVLGGSLIPDVRSLRRHTSNRASLLPTKAILLEEASSLSHEFGRDTLRVNSLHHQAIHKPGANVKIVGRDRDLLCQAIETTTGTPAIGVQWHPEYLFYLPMQRRLFQWLIDRAAVGGKR